MSIYLWGTLLVVITFPVIPNVKVILNLANEF